MLYGDAATKAQKNHVQCDLIDSTFEFRNSCKLSFRDKLCHNESYFPWRFRILKLGIEETFKHPVVILFVTGIVVWCLDIIMCLLDG